MTAKSIDAYGLPARVASYDADMEIMHPNRARMVALALDVLPFAGDAPLAALDVGVGAGYFTERLLRQFDAARVLAVDQPLTLAEDMAALREGGLRDVAVLWREYREVVGCGRA